MITFHLNRVYLIENDLFWSLDQCLFFPNQFNVCVIFLKLRFVFKHNSYCACKNVSFIPYFNDYIYMIDYFTLRFSMIETFKSCCHNKLTRKIINFRCFQIFNLNCLWTGKVVKIFVEYVEQI